MPKWKYFANLFLTMVENATFYVYLSEYHSGSARTRSTTSTRFTSRRTRMTSSSTPRSSRKASRGHEGPRVPIQTRYFDEAIAGRLLAGHPLRAGDPQDDGSLQAPQEEDLVAPDLPTAPLTATFPARARRGIHYFPPDRERRSDAIALAVLAILASLLFVDVLLGSNDLYIRDLAHYYHPAKKILRDIVLDGEFPYWNRWFAAGQPLAANPEHESSTR